MFTILHRRVGRVIAGTVLAAGAALALAGCQPEPRPATASAPAPVAAVPVHAAAPATTAKPPAAPAPAPPAPAPRPHPVAAHPAGKPSHHRPAAHRPAAPAPTAPPTQTVDLGGGWSAYCTGGYLQPNGVCTNRPGGYQPPPAPTDNPCAGTGTECLNAMFGGSMDNDIPALMGGR